MPAIIGTAGHIDHGKTALISALTGQDTDRLKEEKERGISIDLGFAFLDLPDGARAGIVDVPGHERFIRNMLAGAHGIDVVLLVVAADDGVMPQTEEHLEILHLLGVARGIAVITKTDLVSPARVEEVRQEVGLLLDDTRLAGAPILAVSSAKGEGIARLRDEIARQLASAASHSGHGAFRLPIDRAFIVRGHGVVVTGTAISGRIAVGGTLRLLPGGEECRVRSLQVHGAEVDAAVAGQRVAINLGGVEKTEVQRGHLLADRRFRETTSRLDVALELRPCAARPLRNQFTVRFHLHTASTLARAHVLDGRAEIVPGSSGYCQLVLDDQAAAVCGDRFVIRDESSRRTLGGGVVLQPLASRHRRDDGAAELLAQIEASESLGARLRALVRASGADVVPLEWLWKLVADDEQDILVALRDHAGVALLPSEATPEAAATLETLERLSHLALEQLAQAHREAPMAAGVEMELLRARVAPEISAKLFRAIVDRLEQRGALRRSESQLRLPTHEVALNAGDRALATRAEGLLATAELAPPDPRQMAASLAVDPSRLEAILVQLEREGQVVRAAPALWFSAAAVERARHLLADHLRAHGEISAAVFRDLIHGSRKYSIALLDYFDRTGFTLRVGDLRKLGRGSRR